MNTGLIMSRDADAAQRNSGSPLGRLLPRRLWRTPAGAGWGPLPEMLLTLTVVTGIDYVAGTIRTVRRVRQTTG